MQPILLSEVRVPQCMYLNVRKTQIATNFSSATRRLLQDFVENDWIYRRLFLSTIEKYVFDFF